MYVLYIYIWVTNIYHIYIIFNLYSIILDLHVPSPTQNPLKSNQDQSPDELLKVIIWLPSTFAYNLPGLSMNQTIDTTWGELGCFFAAARICTTKFPCKIFLSSELELHGSGSSDDLGEPIFFQGNHGDAGGWSTCSFTIRILKKLIAGKGMHQNGNSKHLILEISLTFTKFVPSAWLHQLPDSVI